jgi:hypothetical protein
MLLLLPLLLLLLLFLSLQRQRHSPGACHCLESRKQWSGKNAKAARRRLSETKQDATHHSRNLTLSRAIDWLCSWHTRLSVTLSTAAISFRFMSCS